MTEDRRREGPSRSGTSLGGTGLAGTGRIPGVTGAILAGGQSTRMGRNKALLPWEGGTVIEAVASLVRGLFDHVLVVAADPEPYRFLGLPEARDHRPGLGPLGGVEAALRASPDPRVFIVACDMPFLSPDLIRHMASLPTAPAVVPYMAGRPEPLHALYSRDALASVHSLLAEGERRVYALLDRLDVRRVEEDEVRRFGDPERVFANLNRPEDYRRARGEA